MTFNFGGFAGVNKDLVLLHCHCALVPDTKAQILSWAVVSVRNTVIVALNKIVRYITTYSILLIN